MSELSAPERNSNSKTNLIDVQHVGVTAKLQTPLKSFIQFSNSSTETEHGEKIHHNYSKTTKYNKFCNESNGETGESTDTSKVLYEMRAIPGGGIKKNAVKGTPSKIEFQLYNRHPKRQRQRTKPQPTKSKKKLHREEMFSNARRYPYTAEGGSIFTRLRHSLDNMRMPKQSMFSSPFTRPKPSRRAPSPPLDTRIGIYPFEHGCAEYLRTTDCHPQIVSFVLAERATHYATRFWAEFFGSLHIGVSFVVTFLLQTYRFILYSLVNTLCVGFLHMTSDYLIKPVLTVVFSGFLQPVLIFIYNVLASIRDILEPVADTLNNFMKPVATVGKSLRLIHTSYSDHNRKIQKPV